MKGETNYALKDGKSIENQGVSIGTTIHKISGEAGYGKSITMQKNEIIESSKSYLAGIGVKGLGLKSTTTITNTKDYNKVSSKMGVSTSFALGTGIVLSGYFGFGVKATYKKDK